LTNENTAAWRKQASTLSCEEKNMKALLCDKLGSPDFLQFGEAEKPVPRENEVLVKVRAVSINDWDWGMLLDNAPNRLAKRLGRQKKIIGSDVAGLVESIGRKVTRLKPGDAVFGDLSRFGSGGWGGFAEYVCARETSLVRKPERMSFEQAAAIPQAGMLALQGLRAGGPRRPGQTILINGAGGGVGTFAIQLAKLQDVEVTGVDSAGKLDLLPSLGFDHVIDYEKEDFTNSGRRYDFILDTKTNRPPSHYLRALNPGGTYATVGGTAHLLKTAVKGLLGSKSFRLVMLKQNRELPYLNQLFEAGKLVPVIDGSYRFSETREAFRHFGAARHKGKIVVTID
jgi:NADPH:quinone reductase-like Zn-dependent oxidoreductase